MSKVDFTAYAISPSYLTAEQMAVFKEGLFKSKGASNTRFGAELAVAGATADEIARLCANVIDRQFLVKSNQKHPAPLRAVLQVMKEVPNFWDTVKGRKLKERSQPMLEKLGLNPDGYLPVTKFDANLSEIYLQRTYRVLGETYCRFQEQRDLMYDSYICDKIVMVDIFEPLSDTKFSSEDAVKALAANTVRRNKSYIPKYEDYRKYEIDSLAHMDEDITVGIEPRELMIDVLHEDFSGWFRSYPENKTTIQTMCIIEAFYEVCREMGIVGVVDDKVNGKYFTSQAVAKGIMKSVIKYGGTYRRLVKSGFAESVARETVLAEINDNIVKRASHPSVRFYPRNDYKDTPEEERIQTKPTTSSGSGRSRRRVLTLEEFAELYGLEVEEEE